jgi:phosphoribosylaminoimidazole-succinocarboxamide synthase
MGSVKDLRILKNPGPDTSGVANFDFSDRYSVFDWGEMPDHIRNKGMALCLTAAHFFERLPDIGIRSHYVGLVEQGKVKRLTELASPAGTMQVNLLQVIRPKLNQGVYDYSVYRQDLSNFLIPLECIYRNTLPEGSSIFKRLKSGSLKLADIGLTEIPAPGQVLQQPILDFSTKLEPTDRYLSQTEARQIAGLDKAAFARIKEATLSVNRMITAETERMGLVHEDGKIEFGMSKDKDIILVDVMGTPDECRFTYQGTPVSKEVARIHYRKTEWFADVEQAKKKDAVNWKKHVKSSPPKLPQELATLISQIYMSFCNELTGRDWFDTPALREVLSEVNKVLGAS